jgi:hypothetical protein
MTIENSPCVMLSFHATPGGSFHLPRRIYVTLFAYESLIDTQSEQKVHTLMAQQGDRVTRFLIALIALNGDADQSFQRYKLIMGPC